MTDTKIDENLTEVSEPAPFPGVNHHLLLGRGLPVSEQDQLSLFSDKKFEIFVEQWAFGYLKKHYVEVQRRGGAGDMGRDVIAWLEPKGTPNRRWDNYQCKHYPNPLMPSEIWLELGKLCYFTFKGHYTKPDHYYFVAPKGIGPKLGLLLDDPEKLRNELILNWKKYCQKGITDTGEIPLEGLLKTHVENFDFSIVGSIEPLRILEEHGKTRYHAQIFGTELKPRPPAVMPPGSIATVETRYVAQIFEAFSDHLKTPIAEVSAFSHNPALVRNFNHARTSFYCAESLKEFARDALADDSYFTSLMEQYHDGIFHTVHNPHHKDGLERMIKTVEVAQSLNITAHVLCGVLEPNDKTGICHHLANEDKISWVP